MLRRRAEAPEHFRLDRQLVSCVRIRGLPPARDFALDDRQATLDQILALDVGEVREAQDCRCLLQLLHQHVEARTPLRAHLRRARLEHGVGEIQADHTVQRRTEVELQRFTARGAFDLHLIRRGAEAARQRAVVELQDEVAAASFARNDRAGDVESSVSVRRRRETARAHDAHARQAGFAEVLVTVAVGVVEHLAGDVRTVERRIRYDADRRGRFVRQRGAGQHVSRLHAIHELAFADTGADREQHEQLMLFLPIDRQVAPDQLTPGHCRLDRLAVDARRAFDVAEARRDAVDDAHVEQRHLGDVLICDHVRHELAAHHVQQRRRLGDLDRALQVRIHRDVVVVDLARARDQVVVELQMRLIPRAGTACAHGQSRRELRGLDLAIVRRRRERIVDAAGARGYGERSGRRTRGRRNDRRVRADVAGRRRRHIDDVIAVVRTRRICEVQVEAVIAARQRDLALLGRIVEARRRQQRVRACTQHAQRHARDGAARHGVVRDAVRRDRQVQLLQVAGELDDDVADLLQPVRERRRVGEAQLRGVRRRLRRAEAQLVLLARDVVRRDAADAIHAVRIGGHAA